MVIAIPCAWGVRGLSRTDSPGCRTRRAQVDRGAFPPAERGDVGSSAPQKPADTHGPATRWSLEDSATALLHHGAHAGLSRASLWRLLDEADLTPHRSVSWLNRHAPALAGKAHGICQRYVHALRFSQEDRLVIWVDEKTGRHILQRHYSTQLVQAGQPEKRDHEESRHGVRAVRASFLVPTGQGLWHLGVTRTSEGCAAPLTTVVRQLPAMARDDWVRDHLKTHGSLEGCQLGAAWGQRPCEPTLWQRGRHRRAFLRDQAPKHVLHCTPLHGAGLPQVALWFSVLARRLLTRGDCGSVEDCAGRLGESLEVYHTPQAQP